MATEARRRGGMARVASRRQQPAACSLLLVLGLLAVRPEPGAGYSSEAGSCRDPSGGHGSGGATSGTIIAPATAAPGELVDVRISHSTSFTGLILKANGGATFGAPFPAGTSSKRCLGYSAMQHQGSAAKNNLVFSLQMPCSAGSVALTGSLVWSHSTWSLVNHATIAVTGDSVCPATCAGFDCSGQDSGLAAAPSDITCSGSDCTASECCTSRTCAGFDCSGQANSLAAAPEEATCADSGCTAGGCCTGPAPDALSLQLAPEVLMSWTVAGDIATVELTYTGLGWLSFGTAERPGAMIGGEVLIGQPGAGVAWYTMSSKLLSGVTATSAAVLPGSSITQAGGRTVLQFDWALPEASGPVELLWAAGSSNTLSPSGHEQQMRGGTSLDLRSGASETSIDSKKRAALIIHGGLMLLGWGLLLPLGILASIYRSRVADGADGIWLKYHARMQVSGVVLGCVAVAIPWWVMDASSPLSSPKRPALHATVGWVLTAYGVAQLILGKARPAATKAGAEPTTLRALWEKVHKYSGRIAMLVALLQLVSGSLLASDFVGSDNTAAWLVGLAAVLLVDVARALQLSRACSPVLPDAVGDAERPAVVVGDGNAAKGP